MTQRGNYSPCGVLMKGGNYTQKANRAIKEAEKRDLEAEVAKLADKFTAGKLSAAQIADYWRTKGKLAALKRSLKKRKRS